MSGRGVFGVRFRGAALPGLVAGPSADAPTVWAEYGAEAELDARWTLASSPERLFERRLEGGEVLVSVDRDPVVGFRVWARGFGMHLVAPDGAGLVSALPDGPPWRSTRLLTSQVFPLLALLRGREVLHAGAAVLDGRLIAVTAPSGTGKSSTIAHLIAGGGDFFADDALALTVADTGRIVAHPGPRLLSIAREQLAAISSAQRLRLGNVLGEEGKTYVEPESPSGPLPLAALVFLERAPDGEPNNSAGAVVDWRDILASVGQPWWSDAARASRQFDTISRLTATVPVVRHLIRPDQPASEVAARLVADLVAPTGRSPARPPG